ncbi:hypothetical protein J2Z44_003026 [Clostridium punense]|uniref:Uncharacterized protein n=1 Tax=Clostridium punense TaxID=1054297 RepID=A0ABS4K7T9_9CLOT|nr:MULTISPECIES: hypothetical protein [Clostridium]EQB89776.1 hypothetical protein M918_19050 [Clostridium sp. BL8]MBP2023191.1 hypothetical protein [Clostridium punense]
MALETIKHCKTDIVNNEILMERKVSPNIYHNTKLLLQLYSKVLWRINNSIQEIGDEYYETSGRRLDELLYSLVEVDPYISQARLESRLQSIEDSKSIIEIIDKTLLMLKSYPDNGERYYTLIYKIYITPCRHSENEVIEYLCCSRATYYREKKKAINLLGTILWGYLFPNMVQALKTIDMTQD